MDLVTQISGKYSNDDIGLFEVKKSLEEIGINVRFPENSEIVSYKDGIPLTFVATPERNFYDVEIEFFESIKTCDFHFVYNNYNNFLGYLGYSTSHEICFAIKEKKKIVFQFKDLLFTENVPKELKEIIEKNIDKFIICPMDFEINKKTFFEQFRGNCKYDLTDSDNQVIDNYISKLLISYQS